MIIKYVYIPIISESGISPPYSLGKILGSIALFNSSKFLCTLIKNIMKLTNLKEFNHVYIPKFDFLTYR